MDAATADVRVKRLVAWTVTPVLIQGDIDDAISQARRPDSMGRVPSDPAWEGEYDLNFAAYLLWEQKASQASGAYDIATLGKTLGRSALFDHCDSQAKKYKRKIRPTSIAVGSRYR